MLNSIDIKEKFLGEMMKERARSLRQDMTLAENRMWYFLRNRRLKGYKFVREYIIGSYIADFVCREKKVVIEIDGSQHIDAAEYDQQRTEQLGSLGYSVLRFWNNDVFNNIEVVLNTIVSFIETGLPEIPSSVASRHLLPKGRRDL
jgi:very-short-patch-repair endonuclease